MRLFVFLLLAAGGAACRPADTEVVFYRSETHRFSPSERRTIEQIATATVAEVRRLLPMLSKQITLHVETDTNVIPEIGATGSADSPSTIRWRVDPDRAGGVQAIATSHLRTFLFHELHHLARGATLPPGSGGYIDAMITEGLATAFERDFGGARPLWGIYPDNVGEWVTEVRALPTHIPRRDWMFQHPDGRRWIGYKVGTYLVDRAMRASGKSAVDLVSVPADQILTLGGEP
jgi:hypothetical protein